MNLAVNTLSKKERVYFISFSLLLTISTIIILSLINNRFLIPVPVRGGSIVEGMIGTPRLINPVLALTDTDRDMVSLVYSGLMRHGENGAIVPDLARSYTVSPDGLTYTFTLKDKLYFHDGKKLTSEDVLYTIKEISDPVLKSPKSGIWSGVSVSAPNTNTVVFTLKQPFSSFLENTTLGILPAHIWSTISSEQIPTSDYNTNPIGSGPYKIFKISRSKTGSVDYYNLYSFKKFALSHPFIDKFTVKFYGNEADLVSALKLGAVDQMGGVSGADADSLKAQGKKIVESTLPRIFALFFNERESAIFTDKSVRIAISQIIDKNKIVDEVLSGHAEIIDGPIPSTLYKNTKFIEPRNIARAQATLASGGWKMGADGVMQKIDKKKKTIKLEFSISTGDIPELKQTAEEIKNDLAEIGIKVDIKVFDLGALNQNVIRPRKYDALLFGSVISKPTDLYAFWHSSERNDPGLNIAMYANPKVDKALKESLGAKDSDALSKDFAIIQNEIKNDVPVVFLYSPYYIYVTGKNLGGMDGTNIGNGGDRFSNVYKWYVETDKIWKIFKNN